mmetsp:Transcript_25563/g.31925  ORF Transcript_25563/g.31925 Transcript_25563/m.31925 type:complete len:124 (-) Transcript_25563:674-1045(-)
MTFLIPRFLFILSTLTLCSLLLKIWLIGHNKGKPVRGLRRLLCVGTLKVSVKLMGLLGWWTNFSYDRLTLEQVNHYEEYLGPREEQKQYQEKDTARHPDIPKRGKGPSSTMVCNHIGCMEILN